MTHLLADHADGVTTLTLDRPEARNALSRVLSTELATALREADADSSVGCIVLTGTDPAFCAGQDLAELAVDPMLVRTTPPEESPYETLAGMATPVVGAINGATATGGLEIALWCDFLIASERARFADTHARVGALPGGGMSFNLPQAVGLRMAKEMSLTARWVDADEALAAGLVNRVVPHDELLPTALDLARAIAGNDRAVVAALKDLYDRTASVSVGDARTIERRRFGEWLIDAGMVEDVHRG